MKRSTIIDKIRNCFGCSKVKSETPKDDVQDKLEALLKDREAKLNQFFENNHKQYQ